MKLATNTFREVLRLSLASDFSATRIGEILGVATNTVLYYRKQLDDVDMTWDQLKELSDSELAMKFMVSDKHLVALMRTCFSCML